MQCLSDYYPGLTMVIRLLPQTIQVLSDTLGLSDYLHETVQVLSDYCPTLIRCCQTTTLHFGIIRLLPYTKCYQDTHYMQVLNYFSRLSRLSDYYCTFWGYPPQYLFFCHAAPQQLFCTTRHTNYLFTILVMVQSGDQIIYFSSQLDQTFFPTKKPIRLFIYSLLPQEDLHVLVAP